jgi:hypothetical protein
MHMAGARIYGGLLVPFSLALKATLKPNQLAGKRKAMQVSALLFARGHAGVH